MYNHWAANLGLAVQWESQQLALCSELMMGGWDSWREEIVYTMSCFQRLQPVGSEGWRVHWATENVDRPHNHSSHKSRCRPGSEEGETKTQEMTAVPPTAPHFSFTQETWHAYFSTQKTQVIEFLSLHRVSESNYSIVTVLQAPSMCPWGNQPGGRSKGYLQRSFSVFAKSSGPPPPVWSFFLFGTFKSSTLCFKTGKRAQTVRWTKPTGKDTHQSDQLHPLELGWSNQPENFPVSERLGGERKA